MKLIGLMPCRNEEWCIGLSARAALMWLDMLVIHNHASTDASSDILAEIEREHPGRVVVLHEDDPKWDEMRHRQDMLTTARYLKATHVAIIDADEVLTGNLLPSVGRVEEKRSQHESRYWGVRQQLEECIGGHVMQLPGYNLRGSINRYHADGIWGRRWFSTAFRDDARLSWGGDTFHAREPKGIELRPYTPIAQGQGGVVHLWGASERRLRAKSALYKVTERLRWPDKPVADIERMYNWATKGENGHSYGTPDTWTYRDVPAEWWAPYAHLMKHLDVDAEPWQEAEVRRLVAEHGAERFVGLDLFGVT